MRNVGTKTYNEKKHTMKKNNTKNNKTKKNIYSYIVLCSQDNKHNLKSSTISLSPRQINNLLNSTELEELIT